MPIAHAPAPQKKIFLSGRRAAMPREGIGLSPYRLPTPAAAHTCPPQMPMQIGLPLRGKRAAYWPHIPAFARGSCRPTPFAAAAGLAARSPCRNAALCLGRQRPPKNPGRAACLRTASLAAAARRKPPAQSLGSPETSPPHDFTPQKKKPPKTVLKKHPTPAHAATGVAGTPRLSCNTKKPAIAAQSPARFQNRRGSATSDFY